MAPNYIASAPKSKGNVELKQYNDQRVPKTASAPGRPSVWPPPMYMDNAKGHKEYNDLCYPLRTCRQKSIVDVKDVSGDRAKGAQ